MHPGEGKGACVHIYMHPALKELKSDYTCILSRAEHLHSKSR